MFSLLIIFYLHWISSSSVFARDETLILLGLREAQAYPDKTLSTVAGLGSQPLTQVGAREAFGLGQSLRDRYGSLLSLSYKPEEVQALTSSWGPARATAGALMTGIFPPTSWTTWNPFSSAPTSIADNLLKTTFEQCPGALTLWTESMDQNFMQQNQKVIDYVAQNTGWPPTLESMQYLAENLQILTDSKGAYPSWIRNPTLSGFSGTALVNKILEFKNVQQAACANNELCSLIYAGNWLKQVVKTLRDKQSGRSPDLKLVTYTADEATVLSLMKLLDYDYDGLPTSGGWLIAYREVVDPEIKFYYHEPGVDPSNREWMIAKRNPMCKISGIEFEWCPLDKWIESIEARLNKNVEELCKNVGGFTPSPTLRPGESCPDPNRDFSPCGSPCPAGCGLLSRICIQRCTPGCYCRPPLILSDPKNLQSSCILPTACPPITALPPTPYPAGTYKPVGPPTPGPYKPVAPPRSSRIRLPVVIIVAPGTRDPNPGRYPAGPRTSNGRRMVYQCVDSNPVQCPLWARRGDCNSNPYWMKPNCQKSCQCCGCTQADISGVRYTKSCSDGFVDCPFWARTGQCAKNPVYMHRVCRASCKLC